MSKTYAFLRAALCASLSVAPALAKPGAIHFNTLDSDHEGAANCVFRQRVALDAWDQAPSLRFMLAK
jgi:hypothetical protein